LKFSISNLAWGKMPLDQVIPKLANAGLHGVEIAPTAIWPNLDLVSEQEIIDFKEYLEAHNLVVSGIQSLLYGRPELQLFDRGCWGALRQHLENAINIGGLLGADVAVFGSPKNRLKKSLKTDLADDLAKTFLVQLENCLKANSMVLTLEPNAPEYGADYLTFYEEVVQLCQKIDSEVIKPQIDTGCLWLVDKSPEKGYELSTPHHIHLSTPYLKEVPGSFNFKPLFNSAIIDGYDGWMVIEMLNNDLSSLELILSSINWLTEDIANG
jgi:D-psicose/D-tagatose/L-ribulose 3-epimerase